MRTPVAFDFKKEYKEFYLPSTKPDIVMPPLEGFWKQEEIDGMDYAHKEKLYFTGRYSLRETDPNLANPCFSLPMPIVYCHYIPHFYHSIWNDF